MERYFDIAGSRICVTGPDSEMFSDAGVLAPFETDEGHWDRWMAFSVVEALTPPEGEKLHTNPERRVYRTGDNIVTYVGPEAAAEASAYMRMSRRGRETHVQAKHSIFRGMVHSGVVLTAMDAAGIAVENDGFILHSSCIAYQGEAILFTAPSGTGKSTQADLWKKYRGAEIINGDRMMVQVTETGCRTVGIPFSGSSGICKNKTLPLKAIVCLSQAPENTICRLRGVRAFRQIWEGCSVPTWDRPAVEQCMNTVTRVLGTVPVWHLCCRPDEGAVQTLEEKLAKGE